jgi:tryptophan-rich sensory protein
LAVWLLLMVSGALSIAWSRRSPATRSATRLILALVPVGLGIAVFNFHIQFTFNELQMGLGPFFLLPVILGIVAIIYWIRARRQNRKTS